MLLDVPDLPDTIWLLSVVTLARTTENPIQQYCVHVLIRFLVCILLCSLVEETPRVFWQRITQKILDIWCVYRVCIYQVGLLPYGSTVKGRVNREGKRKGRKGKEGKQVEEKGREGKKREGKKREEKNWKEKSM